MHSRNLLLALAAAAMTLGITLAPVLAQTPMALSGQVSSAADGPMEGVVVSAKREGSTATISVVSDSTGKFGFPASRLAPGRDSLAIRAVGYDLEGPKKRPPNRIRWATTQVRPRWPTRSMSARRCRRPICRRAPRRLADEARVRGRIRLRDARDGKK